MIGIWGIKSILLGKSFDSEVLFIRKSNNFVNSGESSLSDFLDWLVAFMEAILVEVLGEMSNPDLSEWLEFGVKFNFPSLFFDESDTNGFGEDSLFRCSLAIQLVNGLELEFKDKFCLVEILWGILVWDKDGKEEVGKWNVNLWSVHPVEEEGWLKAEWIILDEGEALLIDRGENRWLGVDHIWLMHWFWFIWI